MKRFGFSLERVRRWRALQQDTEQARLDLLRGDLLRLGQAVALLDRDREAAERTAIAQSDSLQLARLGPYGRYIDREKRRLGGEQDQTRQRIERQQRRLMEARRNSLLLDNLKSRAWRKWRCEFEHEIETQAAESAIERWRRRPANS